MNELCLWEVAKIHFVVSNMDFCAGRSLMSLHVLDFVCVCFYACVLQPNYACESIFLFLVFMCLFSFCVCFQVHVMCGQFVGLPVEYT